MTTAETYLNQFRDLKVRHAGPAPWTVSFDFGRHDKHILFGSITHGDETGSLPAVVRMIEDLESGEISYGGRVTFMLGNVEACRQNRRFIEADLNRVFKHDLPDTLERRRSEELMPVIAQSDLFIDFHQTIEASNEPFWIFTFHTSGYYWARLARGDTSLITREPGIPFSQNSKCADEYARDLGIPALTLEMGQKGLTPQAEKLTYECMVNAMSAMDEVAQGASLSSLTDKRQAADLRFLEIQHVRHFTNRKMALHPGLKNFTLVKENETIGIESPGGATIQAPQAGYLVFPKYPERNEEGEVIGPVPGEIFNLAVEMQKHPFEVYDLSKLDC